MYARVLNAYARVLNAVRSGVKGGGIEGVCVGVERVRAGVEYYPQVSRVVVLRARESGQMGWESESETRESQIVYIPTVPMHGHGRKMSSPTHI